VFSLHSAHANLTRDQHAATPFLLQYKAEHLSTALGAVFLIGLTLRIGACVLLAVLDKDRRR
jgi:hypothetical protein